MNQKTKTSYVIHRLLMQRYRYIVIYTTEYEFYYSSSIHDLFTENKRYIEFFKPSYDVKYKNQ
jgi:hypothetical protein